MKILVIDNGLHKERYGAKSIVYWILKTWARPEPIHVTVRRGPNRDLPNDPTLFDRIIISGSAMSCLDNSPWVEALDQFLVSVFERRVPTLGICYGHQSIARAVDKLQGRAPGLRRAEKPELGWTRVSLHKESELFRGLSEKEFYTYSQHFEEVFELPAEFIPLASSERCGIQAYEVSGRPIFGIQFHPEYRVHETEKFFDLHRSRGNGGWLMEPNRGLELYDERVPQVIFSNFLEKIGKI
jgi:GMP synthase-like glutamine amidotransferase